MGRDKAFVEVDGVAMVLRIATVLRAAGCEPVFAVGGDEGALAALGIDFVNDLFRREGPVGGVITALTACDSPSVLVVACDLAYLTVNTVNALVAGAGTAEATVAVTDRVQPMCVLWTRGALDALQRSFAAGERRLLSVLDRLATNEVHADPQDLANVNAPGDLPQ